MQYIGEMEVIVVGGGLVGALCALSMGKRGFKVKLMEKRPFLSNDSKQKRSINLALSKRGLTALNPYLSIENKIPMYGRCIHPSLKFQSYSPFNKAIYSVDRHELNKTLVEALDEMPNIKVFYNHTLVQCDFDSTVASFEVDGKACHFRADLIVGCDGAYSSTRYLMMRKMAMNYQQHYIDHLYTEIKVLPKNGDYVWNPNCLHIWPKLEYMLIALPNMDKSFTATLFMDEDRFKSLKSSSDIISFFQLNFPDFINTVGPENVVNEVLKNPQSRLVSIKCSPFSFKNVVIIGDASHAMVPFYGQGMNCGFEDVRLLMEHLDKRSENGKINNITGALYNYSRCRKDDAHEISDLAMKNYIEMRQSVTSPVYKIRKFVEEQLHRLFPNQVIPLYTMISFTNIPYKRARKKHEYQTKLLLGMGVIALVLPLALVYIRK
eukprot:NODE_184_length_15718_cov_0.161342.p2 type:complete len:435 gc:universal NODE_184_length_15718_cov_0.161342:10896-12200(+)